MVTADNATMVVQALASDLVNVSKNPGNFKKLPDEFWGYYARGHDKNGSFGVFIAYSEDAEDVDTLIRMYESWVSKKSNISES